MQPVSCAGCQALQRRVRDLRAENERLRRHLDEVTRAGKRQAAPFAKGEPKPAPRKPGKDYGTKAHRQPPSPEEINQVHEAPLPDRVRPVNRAGTSSSGSYAIDRTHTSPLVLRGCR